MTNLFVDPQPLKTKRGSSLHYMEQHLIHTTKRGDLVRSKSEVAIANELFNRQLEYAYEQPVVLADGRTCYPDFTITDHARGVTFYWEHLGMLSDPLYQASWAKKKQRYAASGILPAGSSKDAEKVLIETTDGEGKGLDTQEIARIVDRVILG